MGETINRTFPVGRHRATSPSYDSNPGDIFGDLICFLKFSSYGRFWSQMFVEMAGHPEKWGRTHSGGNEMQKFALVSLIAARFGCAEILYTSASVRPENALIVDIQVLATGKAARVSASYQTDGV